MEDERRGQERGIMIILGSRARQHCSAEMSQLYTITLWGKKEDQNFYSHPTALFHTDAILVKNDYLEIIMLMLNGCHHENHYVKSPSQLQQ